MQPVYKKYLRKSKNGTIAITVWPAVNEPGNFRPSKVVITKDILKDDKWVNIGKVAIETFAARELLKYLEEAIKVAEFENEKAGIRFNFKPKQETIDNSNVNDNGEELE